MCTLLVSRDQALLALFLSWWTSQPAKGVPRAREPFLFHSSVPGAPVPSQFLFCLFHPTQLHGDLSCSFDYMRSSASFQLVFCENCSTCRCIFDVFVGEGELRVLLLCHLDLPWQESLNWFAPGSKQHEITEQSGGSIFAFQGPDNAAFKPFQ